MASMLIKKGKRRPFFLSLFPFITFKKVMEREYVFTDSCKYILNGGDQEDINKLFGLSSFRVHSNSIRVGWRWNPLLSKIELFSYSYLNGVRTYNKIGETNVNTPIKLKIKVNKEDTVFWVGNELKDVVKTKLKGLLLILGLYFGGNQVAPQNIEINEKKV